MSFSLKFDPSQKMKIHVHPDSCSLQVFGGVDKIGCINFISDDVKECTVFISVDMARQLFTELSAAIAVKEEAADKAKTDADLEEGTAKAIAAGRQ